MFFGQLVYCNLYVLVYFFFYFWWNICFPSADYYIALHGQWLTIYLFTFLSLPRCLLLPLYTCILNAFCTYCGQRHFLYWQTKLYSCCMWPSKVKQSSHSFLSSDGLSYTLDHGIFHEPCCCSLLWEIFALSCCCYLELLLLLLEFSDLCCFSAAFPGFSFWYWTVI